MAIKFKDYYETLAVPRTATPDDIKTAFRKLARLYHPDVAKNKATAEDKFKEINEANEVLSDPEKRRRYDELGPDWQDAGAFAPGGRHQARPGGAGGDDSFEFSGTGFSDFFESFFGGGHGGFGSARRHARPDREQTFTARGEDIDADFMVTLGEALRGSVRQVTLRRPANNGTAERNDTYKVRIPPGASEGLRIRLAGQGHPGEGGGAPGDLYLRVRLARHPDFSAQGADLHFDLELAPWEAVLGVSAKITTLDGSASLKVPPGTTAGSQLRMRGLGLPRDSGGRGDLYARVRIQTPAVVSKAEQELWAQLAKASTFNPRDKS
ncbi:MAG: J domain-containing protein [Lacunisphaera sp.]|nr:J domain-containing protein [Lacunisphaera sp.]